MVLNIFGRHGHPTKKLMRMSYWMPKFKNLSPWALPDKIPSSNLEIAKLAVRRMCSVDPASELEVFQTSELKDSIDDTWIVSGQSATQRELLAKLREKQTVFVEGAFTIWLRRTSINYFILRTDPVPLSEDEVKERAEFDYDGMHLWLEFFILHLICANFLLKMSVNYVRGFWEKKTLPRKR